jgi:TPR repeat protein
MEKEPIASYTARLLDAARGGDAKAMATLGRFFYVRGDVDRANEWLGKAARIGHPGAQLDYGVLRLRGLGGEASKIEGYAWVWLATWGEAPGAEEDRSGLPLMVSEFVATFGLIAVISRKRSDTTAVAVADYITAAYWFTPSTSFANPAVTIARSLTDSFTGIRPADVPGFIVAQLLGGAAAAMLFRWFHQERP